MLSGETSAGEHPILSVETMKKIAEETEKSIDYKNSLTKFIPTNDITCGIGYAACALASSLDAKAILVTTTTGKSAQSISRFRPNSNIVALTPNTDIYFKLGMFWGVSPLLDKMYYDTDQLLKSARLRAKQANLVSLGDLVIQTAGIMTGVSGSNTLVASHIEDEVADE